MAASEASNSAAVAATATSRTTAGHYQSHRDANSYESAYFYEPGAYTSALRDKVQRALNLVASSSSDDAEEKMMHATGLDSTNRRSRTRNRILLDVGGGTGNFTRLLLEGTTTRLRAAVVVDPFLIEDEEPETSSSGSEESTSSTSLAPASSPPSIRFVRAGAEDFIVRDDDAAVAAAKSEKKRPEQQPWWRSGYHQVLMKEVVHHIKTADRAAVFRGLRNGLEPLDDAESESSTALPLSTPSLLIITRPQIDVEYPLWEEARLVWANHQPSEEEIVRDLEAAGFAYVSTELHSYPCSIALERWKAMVRKRFWSTFSHFSDEELERAVERMDASELHRIDRDGFLHFDDRLLFIAAHCRSESDGAS